MSLKEKAKAKELVKKFDDILPCEGLTTGETPIKCALIVVDEIINSRPTKPYLGGIDIYEDEKRALRYWQQVKTEINNL